MANMAEMQTRLAEMQTSMAEMQKQARLAAGSNDAASAAKVTAVTADMTLADDENVENEADVGEHLRNGSLNSFYGYTSAMILTLPEDKWKTMAWRSLLVISLQVLCVQALQSVKWQALLIGKWEDDAVWAWGNREMYTYYNVIFFTSESLVPRTTLCTLFLCSVTVSFSVITELKHIMNMYILMRHHFAPPAGVARQVSVPRLVLAYLLHQTRVTVFISFVSSTQFLMGTADGPLNILLNSLAVSFVLEVDGQVASTSYIMGKGLFSGKPHTGPACVDHDKLWAPIVARLARRPRSDEILTVAHLSAMFVTFLGLFLASKEMQQFTSNGEPFTYTTTVYSFLPFGQAMNRTSGSINALMTLIAFVLSVSYGAAVTLVLRSDEEAAQKHWTEKNGWRMLGWGLLEFAAIVVMYDIVYYRIVYLCILKPNNMAGEMQECMDREEASGVPCDMKAQYPSAAGAGSDWWF